MTSFGRAGACSRRLSFNKFLLPNPIKEHRSCRNCKAEAEECGGGQSVEYRSERGAVKRKAENEAECAQNYLNYLAKAHF